MFVVVIGHDHFSPCVYISIKKDIYYFGFKIEYHHAVGNSFIFVKNCAFAMGFVILAIYF